MYDQWLFYLEHFMNFLLIHKKTQRNAKANNTVNNNDKILSSSLIEKYVHT